MHHHNNGRGERCAEVARLRSELRRLATPSQAEVEAVTTVRAARDNLYQAEEQLRELRQQREATRHHVECSIRTHERNLLEMAPPRLAQLVVAVDGKIQELRLTSPSSDEGWQRLHARHDALIQARKRLDELMTIDFAEHDLAPIAKAMNF